MVMFIRQTQTNNTTTGESYFTHRLVRGERVQGKVRQVTVLPLGRHFPFEREEWPLLCQRIEQILSNQETLIQAGISDKIERAAQRYAAAIVARAPILAPESAAGAPAVADPATAQRNFAEVDVDSLQLIQPRSVGVEHLGLHALSQLGLIDKLRELGRPYARRHHG